MTPEQSEVIAGVFKVRPEVFGDDRGKFVQTYRREWFPDEMVQANRSEKQAGVLVGLHYHLHQADYWFVFQGRAQVVLHDLREGSATEAATDTFVLDGKDDVGVYIPRGVAHGFAALTDVTMTYLVDRYYDPSDELGVAWDDPDVDARWELSDPILSKRDQTNPRRKDIPPELRPAAGRPGVTRLSR